MKASELRKSILQAAVQGKLVSQNPQDEPANELYTRIQAEKEQLIKDKKIKKEKLLPAITADETPFDLPNGWMWCRIGDILGLQAGKFIEANKIFEEKSDKRYKCFGGNGLRGYVDSYNRKGDFPLIGRQGALCGNINRAIGEFYATEHAVVVDTFMILDVALYCYFLTAINLNQYSTATAQPGLAVSKINKVLIPLPPLEEQKRIVAKVDELMMLCDELEKAEKIADSLDKSFVSNLPKSILQSAIKGELVPQYPTDEPASELYKRIQAEKEQLIKDKKIKKEKPLPAITADEIPFDLPNGWMWCRLGEVFRFIDYRGKTPNKINSGIPLITAVNIKKGAMDYSKKSFISEKEYSERQSRGTAQQGDILFTTEAPLANVAIANLDVFSTGQRIIALSSNSHALNNRLYMYFLLSPIIQTEIFNKRSGVTATGIKSALLKHVLIPLPPLDEQKRIVAKVDELMALCSELKEV